MFSVIYDELKLLSFFLQKDASFCSSKKETITVMVRVSFVSYSLNQNKFLFNWNNQIILFRLFFFLQIYLFRNLFSPNLKKKIFCLFFFIFSFYFPRALILVNKVFFRTPYDHVNSVCWGRSQMCEWEPWKMQVNDPWVKVFLILISIHIKDEDRFSLNLIYFHIYLISVSNFSLFLSLTVKWSKSSNVQSENLKSQFHELLKK